MNYKQKLAILSAIWIILLVLAFVLNKPKPVAPLKTFSDWESIQKRGYIRAGILQNTTDYYVENGTIKGFHYDLMEMFAKKSHLKVHYNVYTDYWDYFWALMTNKIDVLAMDIDSRLPWATFFLQNDSLPWAVNKENNSFYSPLSHWLDSIKNTRHYPTLLEKYYSPTSKNRVSIKKYQQKINDNIISFYDDLIQKYAQKNALDWRFVAAIIYNESGFNHRAIGKGGAFGLMQFMPKTAAHIGIKNPHSTESQILYGCKYIRKIKEKYAETGVDSSDLYKFVLAAYNAGTCRVDDARILAEKKGYNANTWGDVENMLLKLSDRKYTKNIPLRCGYYNGKFTQKYVSKVWETYRHYQNMAE